MSIPPNPKSAGGTRTLADHDHDMIQELTRRLDAVYRLDEFIENADGHDDLRDFWIILKRQEQKNVECLKSLITRHAEKHCFQ